jgi:hypothetical protein
LVDWGRLHVATFATTPKQIALYTGRKALYVPIVHDDYLFSLVRGAFLTNRDLSTFVETVDVVREEQADGPGSDD